jgi:GNAT superfamily N-acetyltransferase
MGRSKEHVETPMNQIKIDQAKPEDAAALAGMAGELLQEIMHQTGAIDFNVDLQEMTVRAREFVGKGLYHAFLAREIDSGEGVGFIAMVESHALYAEGTFGAIAELYVRRSRGIGRLLIDRAKGYGEERGWRRLEVTTPPLPPFEATLRFYEKHGFAVTGGRKMKMVLS